MTPPRPPEQRPMPAEPCGRCAGRGWVNASQWPSGRDLCPRCGGRRVVARVLLREGAC
jgi:hypothetical protein